jgi:hypothetical protein
MSNLGLGVEWMATNRPLYTNVLCKSLIAVYFCVLWSSVYV